MIDAPEKVPVCAMARTKWWDQCQWWKTQQMYANVNCLPSKITWARFICFLICGCASEWGSIETRRGVHNVWLWAHLVAKASAGPKNCSERHQIEVDDKSTVWRFPCVCEGYQIRRSRRVARTLGNLMRFSFNPFKTASCWDSATIRHWHHAFQSFLMNLCLENHQSTKGSHFGQLSFGSLTSEWKPS